MKKNFYLRKILFGGKQAKRALATVILICSFLPSFAQQSAFSYKIDPAFRFILDHKSDLSAEALNGFPVLYRIEPTSGFCQEKPHLKKDMSVLCIQKTLPL
ncbi:MAG: hypothetical protein V4722_03855 [Bacteroidota bacterium]